VILRKRFKVNISYALGWVKEAWGYGAAPRSSFRSGRPNGTLRRMLPRFARLALALLTAATLVAAGVLTVLALGGGDWAVNLVLRKINPWPGTSLRAADVTGNLLTAPRLYRLSLTRAGGEVMLRADSAAVRYDLRRLVAGDITLAEVRVYGADLILRQRDDGRWDLPAKRTRSPGSPTKQPDVIRLGRVQIVDATARLRVMIGGNARLVAADSIGAEATGIRIDPEVTIEHATVGFRVRPGDLARTPVTVQAQGFLRPGAVTVRRLTLDSDSSAVIAGGIVPLARRAWTRPAAQPAGPQRPAVRAARPWRPAAPARPTRQREDRGPCPRRGRRDGRPARGRAVRRRAGGGRRGGDVIRAPASALSWAGERPDL